MALDAVIQQATRRRDALAQRLGAARVRRQAAGLEAARCEQAVAEVASRQATLAGRLTTIGQWQQWESSLEAGRWVGVRSANFPVPSLISNRLSLPAASNRSAPPPSTSPLTKP